MIIVNYDLNKAKCSKMIWATYCLIVFMTNAKLHVDASGNHIVSTLIMLIICSKFFRISPTEFKTWNFLFPGYKLITSIGPCFHVDGGLPSYCIVNVIPTIRSCESYCTNQKSCVGYAYNARLCVLYVTDGTCPRRFTKNLQRNTAKTMDDLVERFTYSPPLACYGRYSGKIIHSMANILSSNLSKWYYDRYVYVYFQSRFSHSRDNNADNKN